MTAQDKKAENDMMVMIRDMYPICRSITGNGVRETLQIIEKKLPLKVFEVPSGTEVFDWIVPREWNIKDAYIKNLKGERIVDFKKHNLHIVNYSVPVPKQIVSLEELKRHLFTLPDKPDWIPYRTSYYNDSWGFCLTHNSLLEMKDEKYEICIDSTLEAGSLTYGEHFHQGEVDEEIVFYSHVCHPSLCNDNLTGIALATELAVLLQSQKTYYSYRFVFSPGTIGSITWLAQNEKNLSNIKYGLVVALVGDNGSLTYKKCNRKDSTLNKIVANSLSHSGYEYNLVEFEPYGYDERQFCSPGIALDVGRLTRSPNSCFPEYHSSADNLDFISQEKLQESLNAISDIVRIMESNAIYENLYPKCEPQLGKRGLYDKSGGRQDVRINEMALLWVLNMSDKSNSLLDISECSGLPFSDVLNATEKLIDLNLIKLYRRV